jgi:hypothetical protein
MQKQMATEMQKYQFNEGYSNWVGSVMKDPNIPDEIKGQFEKGAVQAQMATAAEATKDQKDNPILGALHKVFSGLAGGEVTKSKSDIPAMQKFMAEWNAKLNLPQSTVKGQQTIIFNQAQQTLAAAQAQAKQEGRPFTEQDAAKAAEPFLPKLDQLWGPRSSEVRNQLFAPFKQATVHPQTAEEKKTAAEADLLKERTPPPPGAAARPTQAPPGSPPSATAPPPGAATQSPTLDKPGAPPASQGESETRVSVLPPYTKAEERVINEHKSRGPSEQVLLKGTKEPVYAQKINPVVTDDGLGIKGGWQLDNGKIVSLDSAEPYKKPAEETGNKKEQEQKVRENFNYLNNRPLNTPYSPGDEAKAEAAWKESTKTPAEREEADLRIKREKQQIEKAYLDMGKAAQAAKGVDARFDAVKRKVKTAFDKAQENAQKAYDKAIKATPPTEAKGWQAIQDQRDQAVQKAYETWKQGLQTAQLDYESEGKLPEHHSWADNLPDDYKAYTEQQKAAKAAPKANGASGPPVMSGQQAAPARPTATDANGNKVQWDGKAWTPLKQQ